MTSKIINMADKIKDAEDRWLESMFRSEPVVDNGFSTLVVKRVRQRLWLSRLSLPVAAIIGVILAFEPAKELIQYVAGLSLLLPQQILTVPTGTISQPLTIALSGMLAATVVLGVLMFTD